MLILALILCCYLYRKRHSTEDRSKLAYVNSNPAPLSAMPTKTTTTVRNNDTYSLPNKEPGSKKHQEAMESTGIGVYSEAQSFGSGSRLVPANYKPPNNQANQGNGDDETYDRLGAHFHNATEETAFRSDAASATVMPQEDDGSTYDRLTTFKGSHVQK